MSVFLFLSLLWLKISIKYFSVCMTEFANKNTSFLEINSAVFKTEWFKCLWCCTFSCFFFFLLFFFSASVFHKTHSCTSTKDTFQHLTQRIYLTQCLKVTHKLLFLMQMSEYTWNRLTKLTSVMFWHPFGKTQKKTTGQIGWWNFFFF